MIVTQGGDYFLSVKGTQPKLREAMQEFCAIAEAEGFNGDRFGSWGLW